METAAQKRTLDANLQVALKVAKAELRKLEKEPPHATRDPSGRRTRRSPGTRRDARPRRSGSPPRAQKKLAAKISEIVRRQSQAGRIPSEYNGTLSFGRWSGNVTQNFGCTGFSWEPPKGSCPHFHSGHRHRGPGGARRSAPPATAWVGYIGWNYADGPDPAWIVIIVHSDGLQTWYAHMKGEVPGRDQAGQQRVTKGQVIGYEGNTGHSTGAHLHWAVMFNGSFVNPRLFL